MEERAFEARGVADRDADRRGHRQLSGMFFGALIDDQHGAAGPDAWAAMAEVTPEALAEALQS